ncbi:1-phosphofructokinase family hexose kinase [Parafrankia sp. EUN1f]|uniref:1-phosphofructokinase family hexose kinase n=1 Tax=Parafrankia sp. EUN1f TaxID=102897 RepID=UPI0001C43EA6|nr:PfkB family carbohydrate kinase [Parafrankia sp. EUN1f]EFC84517.1 PfkB domain protein [Parafrankia sp. EUN1f]
MVFAPSPLLTVTIEARPDDASDIHVHAGGQGVWIAHLLAIMDVEARLCAPFGGETGAVLTALVRRSGIVARPVTVSGENGGYVHDRRAGRREVVATTPAPSLTRHELDELYNTALVEGLDAGVAVLGGPDNEEILPADTYRRLAADLRGGGARVVADLSGDCLLAALAGGVTVLKVSHDDLIRDGHASSDEPEELRAVMTELARSGAEIVIVSRAEQPALVLVGDREAEIRTPRFTMLDHHGAGDSMTAGMAAALARGADLDRALRIGAAAGALNTTRHGLATGVRDLIERLATRVDVRPVNGETAR